MLATLAMTILIQTQTPACPACAGMVAFAADPNFLAAHDLPAPLAFTPVQGHAVTWDLPKGAPGQGFYVPGKPRNRAALVLIHEFWGLNDYVKREAERYHDRLGCAVLAVDLYDGKVATTREDAVKNMQAVDSERGKATVAAAVSALKAGKFGKAAARIGTIGWCFGGGWSFQTAVQGGSNVDACVMYYGMPDLAPEAIAKLHAPVLMVHPTRDKWITAKVVEDFEHAMTGAHKHLQVLHYDADHAFANPSSASYNGKAAQDAFKHTVAFFKSHL